MFHLRLAGLLGFLGVALGAFGAHGLRGRVGPDLLEVWKTGVLYHLVHALALLLVAIAGPRVAWGAAAGWLFVAGIAIFSGSLYALTLTGARWWGAVTPVGGLAFLAGWLVLALTARR
jgi:uncharacterized membrane protein YgdD (TMEM256/DUF423 family)